MERELPDLQLPNRSGMHNYDNQDHAKMTGLMAAWNTMDEASISDELTTMRFT
jgi:hypothetical protein